MLASRGTIFYKSNQVMGYIDDVIVSRSLRKITESLARFTMTAERMGLTVNEQEN